jgi:hypothetical protein
MKWKYKKIFINWFYFHFMRTVFYFRRITYIADQMYRTILFCCIAAIFFSASAKTPAHTLRDTTEQQDEKRNHFYLGSNPTQLLLWDVELYARFEMHGRHSIFIAGGYDFNALDFGKHLDPEDQGLSESVEQESDELERYLWGRGPAYRFGYEVKLGQRLPSGIFLSAEFLMKHRNYEQYQFGDGGTLHSESADQKIYGMSFRFGYEWQKNRICIKQFTGLGFRILDSHITWPVIMDGQNVASKGETFGKSHVLPSLHLGLLIYFKLTK